MLCITTAPQNIPSLTTNKNIIKKLFAEHFREANLYNLQTLGFESLSKRRNRDPLTDQRALEAFFAATLTY